MVKEASFGPEMENSEMERLRRETGKLERLLGDLKAELDQKTKGTNYNKQLEEQYEDWEDEKVAYEIKLQREQARVDAMEEELARNSTKFSNEINMLQNMLQEKRNTLGNMDVRDEDRIRI
mmetsp:Transcript_42903/g.41251  ORF Transcript_42903/g.41251 Transcript_42903/m.41251 type:complete len:121 (+) Transcript_42903:2299-2661(+)